MKLRESRQATGKIIVDQACDSAGQSGFISKAVQHINIKYFALLREQAGKSMEQLATNASSAGELYQELQLKYDFSLSEKQIKVAINDEFRSLSDPLKNNDRVVFIPPVAGG